MKSGERTKSVRTPRPNFQAFYYTPSHNNQGIFIVCVYLFFLIRWRRHLLINAQQVALQAGDQLLGQFLSEVRSKRFKYLCDFCSNHLHSFVQLLIVFISEPPSIANKTDPPTVFTGDSFILNCSANGYPTPVVRWFKDGRLIYQNTSLKFRSLNQSDAGLYMCNASNIAGSDTYELQLVVRGRNHLPK